MIQSWKEYERQGSITSREEEKEWMQTLLLWHSPFSGCMKFLYTFESYSERVYTLYTGFYCLLWSLISLGITNPSLLVSQIPVCLRGYVSLSCTKTKKNPKTKNQTKPPKPTQPIKQQQKTKKPTKQTKKQHQKRRTAAVLFVFRNIQGRYFTNYWHAKNNVCHFQSSLLWTTCRIHDMWCQFYWTWDLGANHYHQ